VLDPVDDKPVVQVTDLTREEVKDAIQAAHSAFQSYKNVPPRERRRLLHSWAETIKANRDDLAAICTLELGKPFSESLVTVDYGTSFLDWFDCQIETLGGETIPAARGDNRIFTIRQPQGVVAAITPWNRYVDYLKWRHGSEN
jgi:succinate-semialdehyde dehydrogenase / glutarate-semialdehyde dehydrogenase